MGCKGAGSIPRKIQIVLKVSRVERGSSSLVVGILVNKRIYCTSKIGFMHSHFSDILLFYQTQPQHRLPSSYL
jgi:hypothetical protein